MNFMLVCGLVITNVGCKSENIYNFLYFLQKKIRLNNIILYTNVQISKNNIIEKVTY